MRRNDTGGGPGGGRLRGNELGAEYGKLELIAKGEESDELLEDVGDNGVRVRVRVR